MTDVGLILRKGGNELPLSQIHLSNKNNLFNELLARINDLKETNVFSRFDIYYEDNQRRKYPVTSNEELLQLDKITDGNLHLYIEDARQSKLFENFSNVELPPTTAQTVALRKCEDDGHQTHSGAPQTLNYVKPANSASGMPLSACPQMKSTDTQGSMRPLSSSAYPPPATTYQPPPAGTSYPPPSATTYPPPQANSTYPPPPTSTTLSHDQPNCPSPVALPQMQPVILTNSPSPCPEGNSLPAIKRGEDDTCVANPLVPEECNDAIPEYSETPVGAYGYYDDYAASYPNYYPSVTCETYPDQYLTPTTWLPTPQYPVGDPCATTELYDAPLETSYPPVIVCNNCGSPIAGIRYRCTTCLDYDICRMCESQGTHSNHNMVRLPCQVPFSAQYCPFDQVPQLCLETDEYISLKNQE